MEFNNHQGINGPSSPRVTQSSSYGFVAEQTRLGVPMIPEMGRNQQFFPNHHLQLQLNPFCPPGQTGYSHDANEASQREMEKRRIREEIIMSEMMRRRELEAEVRRELLVEREMALRQMGGDGFRFGLSPVMGFDSSMRLPLPAISLEDKNAPFVEGRDRLVNGVQPVPFQRGTPGIRISEVDPVAQAPAEKKKILLLAKPDANTFGTKRKAKTPPIVETNEPSSDIVLKKKLKEEWRCEICKICCTGEQALQDHLAGKKHKSKKAAAVTRDGKNYSIGLVSTNATQQVQIASEALKSESGEKIGNAKMYKFWCDICKMGSNAKKVMKNHERGKKHLSRLSKSKNIEAPVTNVEEPNDDFNTVFEVFTVFEDGKGEGFETVEEPKDDSNAVVKVDGDGKGASFENVEEPKDDSDAVVKVDVDGKGASFKNVEEPKDDSHAVVTVDADGKGASFENKETKDDSYAVVKVDEEGKGASFENVEEPKDDSDAVVKAEDDSNDAVEVDEDEKPGSFEDVEEPKDDSKAIVEAKDD